MTTISIASMHAVSETGTDNALRTIVTFCGFGLVASLCLMTLGVDLSAICL
jgi:hypothetical protein